MKCFLGLKIRQNLRWELEYSPRSEFGENLAQIHYSRDVSRGNLCFVRGVNCQDGIRKSSRRRGESSTLLSMFWLWKSCEPQMEVGAQED